MRKDKIILSIVLTFIYAFLLIATVYAEVAAVKNTVAPKASAGGISRSKEEFKADNVVDPFRDPFEAQPVKKATVEDTPARSLPELKLQGIIRGALLNQAIINNKIVKLGDIIQEAKVTKIDKDGVTVFFDNKSYTLDSPSGASLQGTNQKPKGGGL